MHHNSMIGLYEYGVTIIKEYKGKYKMTYHKVLRRKGFEVPQKKKKIKFDDIPDKKLQESISRTKSKIFELSYCNPWQHFITFTLDPKKYDRKNLKIFYKDLTQWINNLNRHMESKIKYLLIPEMHKDGCWHMHGFFMGLPKEYLRLFTLDEKLPEKMREHIKKGHLLYEWTLYRDKFGFNSCELIRNQEACAKYITKYISKELGDCVKEINANMYYCSQGLERAKIIKKGTLSLDEDSIPWDFKNDWVSIKWLNGWTPNALDSLVN